MKSKNNIVKNMTDIDGSKMVKKEIKAEQDYMTKNKSSVNVSRDDNDKNTNGDMSDIKLFGNNKDSQILHSQSFSSLKYDDSKLFNTANTSCDENDTENKVRYSLRRTKSESTAPLSFRNKLFAALLSQEEDVVSPNTLSPHTLSPHTQSLSPNTHTSTLSPHARSLSPNTHSLSPHTHTSSLSPHTHSLSPHTHTSTLSPTLTPSLELEEKDRPLSPAWHNEEYSKENDALSSWPNRSGWYISGGNSPERSPAGQYLDRTSGIPVGIYPVYTAVEIPGVDSSGRRIPSYFPPTQTHTQSHTNTLTYANNSTLNINTNTQTHINTLTHINTTAHTHTQSHTNTNTHTGQRDSPFKFLVTDITSDQMQITTQFKNDKFMSSGKSPTGQIDLNPFLDFTLLASLNIK